MTNRGSYPLSRRSQRLRASEVRGLLRYAHRPDIISFGGGLPNPDTFPVADIREIAGGLLRERPDVALQYGTTQGMLEFRDAIAQRMRSKGVDCGPEDVLVTHGSQQALDLACKVLLDPGDTTVTTQPTYVGFLTALAAWEAEAHAVRMDGDGVVVDDLRDTFDRLAREDRKPKFLYLEPTFHNPAGVTVPDAHRREIVDLAAERGVILIEDDPYSDLRFEGEDLKPLKAYDREDTVIHLGTLSKVLSPGFRIGWAVGRGEAFEKMVLAKQSVDLCTTSFGQLLAAEYIASGRMDRHLPSVRDLYKRKRDLMLSALETHFPRGSSWTRPQGGMFTWVTLPAGVDTQQMLPRAIARGVLYVSGVGFHVGRGGERNMRLNYSYASDAKIAEGIETLGRTITEELEGLVVAP